MEYLKQVLGIEVRYLNTEIPHLPNFIKNRYCVKKVSLDGKTVIFLYLRTELEAIEAVKKHILRVEAQAGDPVVLILDHISYRQKEYLLRAHIPFIVEKKQIYLPFMAVYLQERCNAEEKTTDVMLPSAQMLLFYFIYRSLKPTMTSQAARELELTPTSVQRAAKQLEKFGLIQIKKEGVQRIISCNLTAEKLFEKAKKHLRNPVKRRIYVLKKEVPDVALVSGEMALAEYTMLNPPAVNCYAAAGVSKWNAARSNIIYSVEEQAAVEVWRYDPKKLSQGAAVDKLSLAISLQDNTDERIEEAVEEMLAALWRKIDGNRDGKL